MSHMRFLADMGVALSVVTWLKSHEYDAVHLKDEGLQRLETVLAESQNALERGAIISVEEDLHRVRYLPLQLKK